MANNKVKHYRTTVAGRKPDASKMQEGEIAINMTDKRLFTKMGTSIVNIGNGADATVEGGQTFTGKVTANSTEAKSSVIKSDVDTKLSFNDQFDKTRAEIIAPVQTQTAGQLKIRVKDGQDAARGTAEIVINGNGQVSLPAQGNTASSAVRKDQLDAVNKKVDDNKKAQDTKNASIDTKDAAQDKAISDLKASTTATANGKVNKAGDTMTGNLTVPKVLLSAGQGTEANALTRKDYVDGRANEKVAKAGDTMTGRLTLNSGFSTVDIPNGNTYHWNAWKNATGANKTYLRGFRSSASETMWHETVEGGVYRLATGVTDTQELLKLDGTGYLQLRGEVRPGAWGNLDARYLNTAGDTATGVMNFSANVNLKKELDFEPSDGKSKDTFTILNWGDNTTTGRTQVWELKDSSGYHFYTQRRGSDKQVSASFTGHLTIGGNATVGVQGTAVNSVVRKDYVDGLVSSQVTSQIAGKVNKTGDTMTGRLVANGGVMMNSDTDIIWSRNTDYAKISFVNANDSDANSHMKFNAGDNGNEYFKFVSTSGSTERTWVDIKDGQVIPANYTNFDARYVDQKGDTMTGPLRIDTNSNADGLRIGNTDYSMIFRRSETNFYMIPTAKGQGAAGAISGLRPLMIDMASGHVSTNHNFTAGGVITTGSGAGLKTDAINKRNGTAFIAADGNINLAAATNGFAAGWLFGQLNTRWANTFKIENGNLTTQNLNDLKAPGQYWQHANANTSAARNYPENNAGSLTVTDGAGPKQHYHVYNSSRIYVRAQYSTGGWTPWVLLATSARTTTQLWTGNMGGGQQTPSLSQDLRFRNVWFKTGDQWNFIRFAEDGLYHVQSNGGWIHIQLHSNGRIFKNVQDSRSVPNAIKVENQ